MDKWDVKDDKARREWIASNLEAYEKSLDKWKYDALEIRADLIMTREKLANIYLVTGNDEVLKIMGDLFRAVERLKIL